MDLLAQTRNDEFALLDFQRLAKFGIRTARSGARWHLIEQAPGKYCFDSLDVVLRAAERSGVELILDLFHFGWPDHVDILAPDFGERFESYVRALARYLRPWRGVCTAYAVVNEISFLSWIAGDVGNFFPHRKGEGTEFKRILIRAAAIGSRVVLDEIPGARLVSPEPVIHIIGDDGDPRGQAEAECYRLSQFEAWDMLSGRMAPELGGRPEYLDILGVNFYDRNQWVHRGETGETLHRSDARYRPFHQILEEVWRRYERPIFVSETGTEDDDRADWFHYICQQVDLAEQNGVQVEGVCLYPILNHPGWEDERHCHNGLFDYAADDGTRQQYEPLANAILIEQERLQRKRNEPMNFTNLDLICLSHLRWSFVLQRPQHLMGRFARSKRVFFFEEPIREDGEPRLVSNVCPQTGVNVVTPILPHGWSHQEDVSAQRSLLQRLLGDKGVRNYIAWYYTPMAMEFTSALDPALTVYDCMDELTAFAGAPQAMKANEAALFQQADLVFTGGRSLYASKRDKHSSVYLFPSSVDCDHFRTAREISGEPADQSSIPHPRFGFAGVIDERMDIHLVTEVAKMRPDWHIVLLGPIAKISPESLPKLPNVHLLGMKKYAELPEYFSGWDIGILPFALNDATKYISPTKTPEYLAAGLQVISTPIHDVITPYGDLGLVSIANGPEEFIAAADELLQKSNSAEFTAAVDEFLTRSSWDKTWAEMEGLMKEKFAEKQQALQPLPALTLTPALASGKEVR